MAFSLVLAMYLGEFDQTSISHANLRMAYVFDTPFRLRLGLFHRFDLDAESAIVAFRNRQEFSEEPGEEIKSEYRNNSKPYTTSGVVVLDKAGLTREQLTALRNSAPDPFPDFAKQGLRMSLVPLEAVPRDNGTWERVLQPILSAYDEVEHQAIQSTILPQPQIHQVVDIDSTYNVLMICPPDYQVTDADLSELLALPEIKPLKFSIANRPLLQDFDSETRAKISLAYSRQRKYIFYELAVQSQNRNYAQDDMVAFLLSVMALEGAMAAFINLVMRKRMKDIKKADDAVADFIRDQGVYRLNKMIPYLLMEPDDRPSEQEMKECAEAISMRNAIMHTLTDSKGEYKMTAFTESKYLIARKAILKVYDYYVRACEELESHQE